MLSIAQYKIYYINVLEAVERNMMQEKEDISLLDRQEVDSSNLSRPTFALRSFSEGELSRFKANYILLNLLRATVGAAHIFPRLLSRTQSEAYMEKGFVYIMVKRAF